MEKMSKSKVYFVDSRAEVLKPEEWFQPELSLVNKLKKLLDETNLFSFIDRGDVVAVKVHFGERGTTKYLRPVYVRRIVEYLKELGAKPFVTETTGLGMIKDKNTALGRLIIAEENGFTQQTVSAPIIIADGLLGLDYVEVNINGKHMKKVYVAKAIAEADAVVCVTHFKLHIRAGIGGSIKNVGLGCVAKPTKYDVHVSKPPKITEKCTKCGECLKICPANAIANYKILEDKCVKCLGCYEVCPHGAVEASPWLIGRDIAERIAEAAYGVLKVVGKDNFAYINFMIDVTPHCDCHPYSDNAIVPDIGIFSSRDIVSVDTACIDMLYKSESVPNSLLGEEKMWSWADPYYQVEYAEKLKIGRRNYTLETLD